jgi:hypothetical protein
MSDKMVDITLHIDEATSHEQRESLCDSLRALDGVVAAAAHDEKPHLLVVEYDPDRIKSSEFVTVAKTNGLHAELIGL